LAVRAARSGVLAQDAWAAIWEAGGDPVKAKSIRSEFFARLRLKSAQSRRKAKEARVQAALYDHIADDAHC
jgi:hypothetical protein